MDIDSNGLLTDNGDGGDSCNKTFGVLNALRMSCLAFGAQTVPLSFATVAQPAKAMALLSPSPGIYVRNPDPTKWYSDPNNTSRDQLIPVICFLVSMATSESAINVTYYKSKLMQLLKSILTRSFQPLVGFNLRLPFFAQNFYPDWVDHRTDPTVAAKLPDLITPDLIGMIARPYVKTLWMPIALPIVLLGDLFSVCNNLAYVLFTTDPTDASEDMNTNYMILTCQYIVPTPFSYLSRKIYKLLRRPNNGAALGQTDPVMQAIALYNAGDNPEVTQLLQPFVEKY